MLAMPWKVLWVWDEEVKTDHLRKVCVAYPGRLSDAPDSSPCLGPFASSEPGSGQGTPCGPPENNLARSIGDPDHMEDKKQTASHRGRKSLKSQCVFVMVVNSSPGAAKFALDIRGINRVSTPVLTQMFI